MAGMASTESTLNTFATQLRAIRKTRGWTQEELARRTGRHWTYIGGLERGEWNPTLVVIAEIARALSVSPAELVEEGIHAPERHPLAVKLNAPVLDILSAIERGFRAQIDVKGKLAELYMNRQLEALKRDGLLKGVVWQDIAGQPDFIVEYRGHELRVECKNIRNETFKKPPSYKVELQRTRNSMDGTPTRGYKTGDFDVIGVSLFNQTGRWEYAYVATRHLARRSDMPDFLAIMQRVPIEMHDPWTSDPLRAFDHAIGRNT